MDEVEEGQTVEMIITLISGDTLKITTKMEIYFHMRMNEEVII